MIIEEGKVLLILEGDGATNRGLYSVPGGRCGDGETPAACAVREAFEEACVEVEICRQADDFFTRVRGNCFHGYVFESKIVFGDPCPGGGVIAVCWAELALIEELEKRKLMITGKLLEAVKRILAGAA